jgi:hypothetical protein
MGNKEITNIQEGLLAYFHRRTPADSAPSSTEKVMLCREKRN